MVSALVACGSTASSPPAESAPPTSEPADVEPQDDVEPESADPATEEDAFPGPDVPADAGLSGVWVGFVDQSNTEGYGIRLDIAVDSDTGEPSAQVTYAQLGCDGEWVWEGSVPGGNRFIEEIFREGRCGSGVVITLRDAGEDRLEYSFDHQGVTGEGLLAREERALAESSWPTHVDAAPTPLRVWFGAAWRVGESSLALPQWVSCAGPDLCVAGDRDLVSVIERYSGGYEEVAVVSMWRDARTSLAELGYDDATVRGLLGR